MIDLSKLKPGDTVHFRCGGKAVVESVRIIDDNARLSFECHAESFSYDFRGNNGQGYHANSPFDIIRIESAFRWEDVRPGMAFKVERTDGIEFIAYWVGKTMTGDACVQPLGQARPEVYCYNILTRAPEHDIEVKI